MIAGKTQTISFLIEQNKAARDLIEKQDARIADLESEVALEKENGASIAKSYESAKSEIISLKTSNAALARAAWINEQTIATLQTDNAKQREKTKRATKQKWEAIAAACGVVILKFILP